jgi:hypothetical protein
VGGAVVLSLPQAASAVSIAAPHIVRKMWREPRIPVRAERGAVVRVCSK